MYLIKILLTILIILSLLFIYSAIRLAKISDEQLDEEYKYFE